MSSRECLAADIIIAAVGRPEMVQPSWVKEGAVVIDVGINRVEDATREKGMETRRRCASRCRKYRINYVACAWRRGSNDCCNADGKYCYSSREILSEKMS